MLGEEFSGFKKEQKKTGGVPAPSNPSETTLKITEMFSETPSFNGLQGFETGGFTNGNLVCALKSKLAIKAYLLLLVVKKHDLLTLLKTSKPARGQERKNIILMITNLVLLFMNLHMVP